MLLCKLCRPSRQPQRSFDGLDDLRIHNRPRVDRADLIVKNLAHEGGVTKDASRHGHRNYRAMALCEKAPKNYSCDRSEFPACLAENLRGQVIVRGSNRWKKSGKVWWRY
jgi:hypothetical protein